MRSGNRPALAEKIIPPEDHGSLVQAAQIRTHATCQRDEFSLCTSKFESDMPSHAVGLRDVQKRRADRAELRAAESHRGFMRCTGCWRDHAVEMLRAVTPMTNVVRAAVGSDDILPLSR
jgi:hypothetical protein